MAGYIDADGSIMVVRVAKPGRKGFLYHPNIQISSMDEDIIRWFAEILKVSVVKGKARWSHGNPSFNVRLNRVKDTAIVLTGLLPYLRLKKREAELALQLIDLKLRQHQRAEFWDEFAAIYEQYIALHHTRQRGNGHRRTS